MSNQASWHEATLGLGGNIGDPKSAMATALRRLDAGETCKVLAVSPLYRTPPWGKTDQNWFFNACALVSTSLDPVTLLNFCLSIELEMKRERIERWGPRTIDIDVLTYGDLSIGLPELEVPHPRMTERGFVLKPLADVAPDLPIKGKQVKEWLETADVTGIEPADGNVSWWRS